MYSSSNENRQKPCFLCLKIQLLSFGEQTTAVKFLKNNERYEQFANNNVSKKIE